MHVRKKKKGLDICLVVGNNDGCSDVLISRVKPLKKLSKTKQKKNRKNSKLMTSSTVL
jgi:hypothetical protein